MRLLRDSRDYLRAVLTRKPKEIEPVKAWRVECRDETLRNYTAKSVPINALLEKKIDAFAL
jgi:hypothetical protein